MVTKIRCIGILNLTICNRVDLKWIWHAIKEACQIQVLLSILTHVKTLVTRPKAELVPASKKEVQNLECSRERRIHQLDHTLISTETITVPPKQAISSRTSLKIWARTRRKEPSIKLIGLSSTSLPIKRVSSPMILVDNLIICLKMIDRLSLGLPELDRVLTILSLSRYCCKVARRRWFRSK